MRMHIHPDYTVRIYVYHPETGELVTHYNMEQFVGQYKSQFNRITKACHDAIEAAQSTDGLRYVAYFPIWESWRKGGNRVFESTVE